jgi:iron complex outermembrane receptor protein
MKYRSLKDEILRSGDVSGFNAEDNIKGRVANTDLFVEFYVPLLSDMTAVENLALTAGYRYSDNTPSGTNSSYKAELDWTINDSFRVRGGYQRAVRAPNIAELFSPQNEDNPQVDDPCNYDSVERSGSNVAQVEALCIAQGIPAAVLGTAGDPNSYKQSNSQIDALAGGNPDLEEETADTYTIGVVWTPEFADRLSVSVDYYDIEVSDAIDAINPSTVVARCFNADGANPNFEADNFYCNLFDRFVATSEIKDLQETQNNIGGIRTSGVDLQVDWGFDIGNFGDIGLNFVSTYVNNFERQETPGDIWLDFVGTIGDNVGEALPDWKASLTGVWNYAGFSTMLRMRYLPAMDLADKVISGSTDPGPGSVTYLDLSTRWQVTDALSLRLGIENLTNEDPQLFSPDVDSGTDPSTYDVIGRRYFMTATYKF